MNIIKWFNKKFRGVVYAEDSVPAEGENEFKIILDMTPEQLAKLDLSPGKITFEGEE